jgi:hypothetical protein
VTARLAAAALAVLLAAGCGADPIDPDLYQRVTGITDCDELVQEARTADAYADRYIDRGDLDRAQWANDYLGAIAKRMEELRC